MTFLTTVKTTQLESVFLQKNNMIVGTLVAKGSDIFSLELIHPAKVSVDALQQKITIKLVPFQSGEGIK